MAVRNRYYVVATTIDPSDTMYFGPYGWVGDDSFARYYTMQPDIIHFTRDGLLDEHKIEIRLV